MKDHLTQLSLQRLLAVMLLVIFPHFWNVPMWEVLFLLAMLGYRLLASLRQWQMPHPIPRVILTFAAIGGVFASYGQINGQIAGTALLVAMAVLKLLEMRTRRDVIITVFLLYFILITHFLFSQEMWTILYLLACAVAITAFLIEANHIEAGVGSPLPLKLLLRMGATMVAYALPLMVLLFVLFPRIPGPLWGLPADSGASRSGLPDSMSPGNFARLILSDELAFRVKFDGEPPPMHDRYWRGPIFDYFDGRNWKIGSRFTEDGMPEATYDGDTIGYEITLEPIRTTWLMALDLPSPSAIPPASYINSDHQLVAREEVRERLLYHTASYTHYTLQTTLIPRIREQNLRLPQFGNSDARDLAQQWRDEGLTDEQLIRRALRMYHDEKFWYTLNPPPLGENSVDDFLFKTRKGFCEHYAGSFVFLMRAAHIPARVVTGYHGGEKNAVGDYYLVRQADAHAWSEVWLEGKGWVRIDPTAQVAPDRIESGIENALDAAELPAFMLRKGNILIQLEARWDWVNDKWNHWVLNYGPDIQMQFLAKFGIQDWSSMVMALTIIGTLMLAIIGGLLMRQFRPADNADAALKLWRRALKKLRKHGLLQRPDEGPRDFVRRVAEEQPELAQPMQRVLQSYLQLRYLEEPAPETQRALGQAVAALG